MIILELACLGVRAFRQVTKLTLKPGLNLIHGRTGTGKSTLVGCLDVLLFGTSAEQIGLATNGSGSAQTAVTVRLRKGDIYRVIADLTKNAFQILRWDATSRAFSPVASDPSQLAPLWDAECNGLPLANAKNLVLWSPGSGVVMTGGDDLPAFTPDTPQPTAPLTSAERAAKVGRLAELQTSLARAERLARSADDRADAVAREAQTRNRLAALDALAARRAESAAREDEMKPFLHGTKDLDTQLDAYAKALPAMHEERTTLEEEASALGAQIEEAGATPLFKTPLFLAGAGLTALSFLVAVVAPLQGWLRYLYLLGLVAGLALVVTALVLDFRRLARKRALEAQRDSLQKKAGRLDERLKKTYAAPIALMTQTGCSDADTLKAKRRAAKEWAAEQERFTRDEADLLGGRTRTDLEAEWQTAKARTEELTREAGEDVDIESLRDAIRHITAELEAVPAPSAPPSPTAALSPNGVSSSPLGEHAAEISGCLVKLSDARLEAVAQCDGHVCVTRRGSPDPVPIEQVSSGESIQARVAIALGAWKARAGLGLPLILDEPLAGLDPQSRRQLLNTMAAVAGDRQIIVFTNAPAADASGIAHTALSLG